MGGVSLPTLLASIRHLDQRVTVLTWALGVTAALTVATLGMIVTLSYQLGHIAGSPDILTAHVVLK